VGVFTKVGELIKGGFSLEEALERASKGAQKKQEAEFQNRETCRKWGIEGRTPKEQRELDEKSAQGDPESKG